MLAFKRLQSNNAEGRSYPMKTGLVITAHPGDFVWRAGGAIALHARRGYRVKIVCLSFGERGESQFAWKEQGATLASVKAGRKDEAERAAKLLGPRSSSSIAATIRSSSTTRISTGWSTSIASSIRPSC
jgi:LmbE family N-acetylglucosaminyl deacetylase